MKAKAEVEAAVQCAAQPSAKAEVKAAVPCAAQPSAKAEVEAAHRKRLNPPPALGRMLRAPAATAPAASRPGSLMRRP